MIISKFIPECSDPAKWKTLLSVFLRWAIRDAALSNQFKWVFLPVVVEPGGVARYDNVVGLLGHVVLVKVGAFHWFTLHTRGAFFLLLFKTSTHSYKGSLSSLLYLILSHFDKLSYLSCYFHGLVLLLICLKHKRWINEWKTQEHKH